MEVSLVFEQFLMIIFKDPDVIAETKKTEIHLTANEVRSYAYGR